ncbi:hypothetical protein AB0N89_31275 [Amycolatopsis sp. NPDC089917]|uniref:hypothetical protein n=1 Tax=Amycolatopsis sp. NPDC089917 TaxID=3155187 RepID=UPI00343C1D62
MIILERTFELDQEFKRRVNGPVMKVSNAESGLEGSRSSEATTMRSAGLAERSVSQQDAAVDDVVIAPAVE